MCDPISIGIGLLGAATIHGAEQGRKSASQARSFAREQAEAAVDERANAEAAAAQSAQAKLAADQRRRRQAGGLLSRGAPSADSPLASTGTATIQPVTNATAGKQQSMLSRGSPATFYGG
jgi:hypothetical protein